MKNRLIPCVLACLMIFLVGCTGNTAKEAAQEITKTETSFPAGNTETNSQEKTAEEPESTTVQEETPITAEESQSTAESQTVATVQTKPAEDMAKEEMYHIALDDYEHGIIIRSLNDEKTDLMNEGKSTDAVDDLIIKVGTAPKKKFKVIEKERSCESR